MKHPFDSKQRMKVYNSVLWTYTLTKINVLPEIKIFGVRVTYKTKLLLISLFAMMAMVVTGTCTHKCNT